MMQLHFVDNHVLTTQDMTKLNENDTPLKLSAMADAEKSDYHEDILLTTMQIIHL